MFTFKVFSGEIKADFDFLKTIKKLNFHHLELCGLSWQRDYLLVFFNDVVVGIVCFNPNSIRHFESYTIGYINTHKNFRNIGVSKFAIQKFVEYAKISNYSISNSSYTDDGDKYVKHILHQETEKQGVILYDAQEVAF